MKNEKIRVLEIYDICKIWLPFFNVIYLFICGLNPFGEYSKLLAKETNTSLREFLFFIDIMFLWIPTYHVMLTINNILLRWL